MGCQGERPAGETAPSEPQAVTDNTTGAQLIKYVDHIAGDWEVVLRHVCKLDLEGIISKRADARYRSGRRPEWIRTECGG